MRGVLVCLIALGLTIAVSAQGGRADRRLSQAQTRAVAEQAFKNAQNETGTRFLLSFGDVMQKEIGTHIEAATFEVYGTESLTVRASGPVQQYVGTFVDLAKKMLPRDKIAWHNDVFIEMTPLRLDSPDITKITVQRNGQTIAPTANDLKEVSFSSPLGDTRPVRGGTIRFPLAAFDRGGTVTVTLAPNTGAATVKILTDSDLQKIR